MAKRKRASTQSTLLDRARSAIREAERRVPPDLRRQLERSIKDGQKTLQAALKEVQAQVNRTARQADLDKVLKRLDGMSRQVQQLARSAASAAAPRPATPKPSRRAPAKRKAATRKAAAPKRPTGAAAPRRAAAARRPTTRRSAPAPKPEPPSSGPEEVDSGDSSS
jgi:hypothetical protein